MFILNLNLMLGFPFQVLRKDIVEPKHVLAQSLSIVQEIAEGFDLGTMHFGRFSQLHASWKISTLNEL